MRSEANAIATINPRELFEKGIHFYIRDDGPLLSEETIEPEHLRRFFLFQRGEWVEHDNEERIAAKKEAKSKKERSDNETIERKRNGDRKQSSIDDGD